MRLVDLKTAYLQIYRPERIGEGTSAMPNQDWRDKLALSIAYRMHSIDGIPVEEALNDVRNFMQYGPNSENSNAVWVAGIELFGKALETVAPAIQIAMKVIHETVERELRNGEELARQTAPTS